jgi:CDP-diacylglycerol--glycerol-3-phosphate 3-phosphatidyltransferase
VATNSFGPSALATPSNAVSLGRVLVMPVLVIMVLDHGASWAAASLWLVLTATDLVDGWLARRQGSTRLGAFLDPLADKVVVLGVMCALISIGVFWWVPVTLIAAREAFLVIYRTSAARRGLSIPARGSAKLKTLVQNAAVAAALIPPLAGHPIVATTVLWLAVGMSAVSALQYLLDGRRVAQAG